MTQGDIHYSEESVQNKVEKIKNSEDISEHNRQILLDLTDYMYGQDLSHTRVVRYLYSWTVMIEHIDWDLDEEIPNSVTEKTGNSAVTRFAIKLGHKKVEELQEERELKAKEFRKLQREMENMAQNV